jgi:Zn-finger nucleic acid-binding protein
MIVCKECNKEYKVLVDIDGRNMDAKNVEIETPYCPFCGEVSLDMDEDYYDGLDF